MAFESRNFRTSQAGVGRARENLKIQAPVMCVVQGNVFFWTETFHNIVNYNIYTYVYIYILNIQYIYRYKFNVL
jgi:hypothetical protein